MEEHNVQDRSNGQNEVGDTIYEIFKTPAKFQPKEKLTKKKTPKRKHLADEDNDLDSPSDKVRPRTPSGQILSVSVGNLKTIIEARERRSVSVTPDRFLHKATKLQSGQLNIALMQPLFEHHDQVKISKQWCEAVEGLSKHSHVERISHVSENTKDMQDQKDEAGIISQDGNSKEHILKRLQKMVQDKDSSETVGLEVIIQALSEFKDEITQSIKEEIVSSQRSGASSDQLEERCALLESRVLLCESKERLMIDTIAGLSNKVKELQIKTETSDINNARRMVVLSGMELSQKKKVCRQQLERFFTQEMGIDVMIDDFFWIGSNSPKDIVISFATAQHKHLVFQNASVIKNYRNSAGKKYIFRDYTTPRQTEFNKKCQWIADAMSHEDPVNQEEIAVKDGKLYVGEKKFEQIIKVPDPAHTLRLPHVHAE